MSQNYQHGVKAIEVLDQYRNLRIGIKRQIAVKHKRTITEHKSDYI